MDNRTQAGWFAGRDALALCGLWTIIAIVSVFLRHAPPDGWPKAVSMRVLDSGGNARNQGIVTKSVMGSEKDGPSVMSQW